MYDMSTHTRANEKKKKHGTPNPFDINFDDMQGVGGMEIRRSGGCYTNELTRYIIKKLVYSR